MRGARKLLRLLNFDLSAQITSHQLELFKRSLQILHDFLGNDFWRRQVIAIRKRLIFQSEDVQA